MAWDPFGTLPEHIMAHSALGINASTLVPAGSSGDILYHDGSSWGGATSFAGDYTFSGSTLNHTIDVPSGGVRARYLRVGTGDASATYPFYTNQPSYFTLWSGFGVAPSTGRRVNVLISSASTSGNWYGQYVSASQAAASGNPTVFASFYTCALNSGSTLAATIGNQCNVTDSYTSAPITRVQGGMTGGKFTVNQLGTSKSSYSTAPYVGGDFAARSNSDQGVTIALAIAGKFTCGLDAATDSTMTEAVAVDALNFGGGYGVGTNTTLGTYYGVRVRENIAGKVTTWTNNYGIYVGDQTVATIASDNDAIFVAAQDGTNKGATFGNIRMAGTGYDEGHVQLGAAHIWFDGSTLYGKASAPTADNDGIDLMGTGAMVTNYDDAGGGVSYIGDAEAGSSAASAVWRVRKMVEASGDVTITFADGDDDFDNIWANRASLSYS